VTPTIFALSSGRPPAGIAVVRVSGPVALVTLATLTGLETPPTRQFVRRRLFDPRDATLLDDTLVVVFAAPASATGDDLVELHLHGGSAVVAAVLAALGSMHGLTLAQPGEFTRRAFDNGKLDLSQVEGLADLIDAGTEAQRRQALAHAGGLLRDRVAAWRNALIEVRADVEACLDFAEEDDVPAGLSSGGRSRIESLAAQLAQANTDATRGERIRDGLTVAVTGPVNAGKSSLVNAIAQRDIAIVTEYPGTTRDIIEVRLDLGGVAVTLLDTAGLRETNDPVEAEGIRRAIASAKAADLVIVMGDPPAIAGDLRIASKSDLGGVAGWQEDVLHLSARTRDGIDLLVDWLGAWAQRTVCIGEPGLIVRERQRMAIFAAEGELTEALGVRDAVLVAEHLRCAVAHLDGIIGTVTNDDVLAAIFGRFCIGK
jgi:tRNA modification GTPase